MSWADRLLTIEERIAIKIRVNGECREWTGATSGRGKHLYGAMFGFRVHRKVWELAHGAPPGTLHVLHSCDNPCCIHTSHLFLGTHSDNMKDMYAKKRQNRPVGEKHRSSKLTEDDVREIRRLKAEGIATRELARRYPVSRVAIKYILNGRSWNWLA